MPTIRLAKPSAGRLEDRLESEGRRPGKRVLSEDTNFCLVVDQTHDFMARADRHGLGDVEDAGRAQHPMRFAQGIDHFVARNVVQRERHHHGIRALPGQRQILADPVEIGLGMVRVGLTGLTDHHFTALDPDCVCSLISEPTNSRRRRHDARPAPRSGPTARIDSIVRAPRVAPSRSPAPL
jgi:hypothetical protein